jgi:hypothetical protein
MSNIKKIEKLQALIIILIITLLFFIIYGCVLQEDVCGTIIGGYSEYNSYTNNFDYYFRLTTDNRAKVDELTFYSYRVGDYVCLRY